MNSLSLIEQSNKVCEGCILDKKHRNSLCIGNSHKTRDPLEIVNLDLCGHMHATFFGNSLYFMIFRVDYTRKT